MQEGNSRPNDKKHQMSWQQNRIHEGYECIGQTKKGERTALNNRLRFMVDNSVFAVTLGPPLVEFSAHKSSSAREGFSDTAPGVQAVVV